MLEVKSQLDIVYILANGLGTKLALGGIRIIIVVAVSRGNMQQ